MKKTKVIIIKFPKNPFHLVSQRPWPLVASLGGALLVISLILIARSSKKVPLILTFMFLRTIRLTWWRRVHRESTNQGNHPKASAYGLKIGIILFVISEVFFFVSFFWAFFHRRIAPNVELGCTWPPLSILPFNPLRIPLLNTIILISSGVTVTWAHHLLLKKSYIKANISLLITVILGVLFSFIQGFEYLRAPFRISDSFFGSRFFMATGFHGIHVIIGASFLIHSKKRLNKIAFSNKHITEFECASWYWHFVDVVWLFLYMRIYWWGS